MASLRRYDYIYSIYISSSFPAALTSPLENLEIASLFGVASLARTDELGPYGNGGPGQCRLTTGRGRKDAEIRTVRVVVS